MATDKATIYRFKLSEDVVEYVRAFAQLHKLDDRQSYKEAWKLWCVANKEITDNEVTRLSELGYNGDVLDKMYKAGRYYFRKKREGVGAAAGADPAGAAGAANDNKRQRRAYVNMSANVVSAMDTHIKNNINDNDFAPASGYTMFIGSNQEMLLREKERLQGYIRNDDDIDAKIKKTYKNRYFLISRGGGGGDGDERKVDEN